jgi:hypothetical protein
MLSFRNQQGTCFAIDVDDKQYVVTARHVVQGIATKDRIALMYDKQWKEVGCTLVGPTQDAIDIAVLALPNPLITGTSLDIAGKKIFLSMDIYFLGFPCGFRMDAAHTLRAGYPIPMVKKGIISYFDWSDQKHTNYLLDGHNNPGFSGGPVVVTDIGQANDVSVIAVVSGYQSAAQPICHPDQATPPAVEYNAGIINAYSIRYALDLIMANPIGCPLP